VSVFARAGARLCRRRYGDYIWTASGKRFWPLDPRPEDIELVDIARGLATGCRYSGQLGLDSGYSFYSVAEHCVIVSIAAERRARALDLPDWEIWSWAREALLHDASEAYIGDVSRPVKYMPEMRAYRRIEKRLDAAVAARFELRPTPESAREIKILDSRVLIDEIDAFMLLPDGDDLEQQIAKFGQPLGVNIAGLSPPHAEHVYLQRYAEIEANL
jgi:5'-deoxynucleotidase YfbR-like HD superfamily hydrolase